MNNKTCSKCHKTKPCMRKVLGGRLAVWICGICWGRYIDNLQSKVEERYG